MHTHRPRNLLPVWSIHDLFTLPQSTRSTFSSPLTFTQCTVPFSHFSTTRETVVLSECGTGCLAEIAGRIDDSIYLQHGHTYDYILIYSLIESRFFFYPPQGTRSQRHFILPHLFIPNPSLNSY